MKVHKVRRVGNSNVVSLPREFEDGFGPGTEVLIERADDGSLRLMRTDDVRELIRRTGERVIAEHHRALQILRDHDRHNP